MLGGEHGGEPDGAVTDDGDDLARLDAAHVCCVVAGEVHVGEREEAGGELRALAAGERGRVDAWHDHEAAVGLRDARELGLQAADL